MNTLIRVNRLNRCTIFDASERDFQGFPGPPSNGTSTNLKFPRTSPDEPPERDGRFPSREDAIPEMARRIGGAGSWRVCLRKGLAVCFVSFDCVYQSGGQVDQCHNSYLP